MLKARRTETRENFLRMEKNKERISISAHINKHNTAWKVRLYGINTHSLVCISRAQKRMGGETPARLLSDV